MLKLLPIAALGLALAGAAAVPAEAGDMRATPVQGYWYDPPPRYVPAPPPRRHHRPPPPRAYYAPPPPPVYYAPPPRVYYPPPPRYYAPPPGVGVFLRF